MFDNAALHVLVVMRLRWNVSLITRALGGSCLNYRCVSKEEMLTAPDPP